MSLEAMCLDNDHQWLLKTRWKIGNPITDKMKAENSWTHQSGINYKKRKTIHFEPPDTICRMHTASSLKHSWQKTEPEHDQASG